MPDSKVSCACYWEARFFWRAKGAPIYVGYARRRVPRATDAKRRLLARGEVAFAKQMTEGALQPSQSASPPALPKGEPSPLSHRFRGDSSPINGGAFGAPKEQCFPVAGTTSCVARYQVSGCKRFCQIENYQDSHKSAARMRRVVPQSRASARNINASQLFFLHTFSGAAEKVCRRRLQQ